MAYSVEPLVDREIIRYLHEDAVCMLLLRTKDRM